MDFLRLKREAGFTLIEFILTIAILGIVSLIVGSNLIYFFDNSQRIQEQNEIIESINSAIYSITFDIRNAQKAIDGDHPVEVENNGRLLRIYKWNSGGNMIEMIYELEDDGSLVREYVSSNNSSYPFDFNNINGQNRKVVLQEVEDGEIFKDLNPGSGDNQRKIQIEISVDNKKIQETFLLNVTSRNRGKGGI